MKISFIYSTPKPWDWCQMCILGVFTFHDRNIWQLLIGLYFLDIGIQIDWGNNTEFGGIVPEGSDAE